MITIPLIILLTLCAFYGDKNIRKHNVKLYIGATLLSIVAFLLRNKLPLTEPLNQGYLGLAFFYIVMMAGAIKPKTTMHKRLMSVRREYSILGFIFLTPHGAKYVIEFLLNMREFEWLGVIPYVIMFPLFVTSFMIIRRKMSVRSWRKLQKFAYIAYVLMFIHLLLAAEMPNLIVYIVLFVPYFFLKIRMFFFSKQK